MPGSRRSQSIGEQEIYHSPFIVGGSGIDTTKVLFQKPPLTMEGLFRVKKMAIKAIEDAKILRKYGEKIGREGIAKAVIEICKRVAGEEHYIKAIQALGELQGLAIACKFDCYWDEKRWMGFEKTLDLAEFETKKEAA